MHMGTHFSMAACVCVACALFLHRPSILEGVVSETDWVSFLGQHSNVNPALPSLATPTPPSLSDLRCATTSVQQRHSACQSALVCASTCKFPLGGERLPARYPIWAPVCHEVMSSQENVGTRE